jgi:hypothetical protein
VNWANVFWVRNGNSQTPGLTDFQAFLADFGVRYWDAFGSHMHPGITTSEVIGLYYGPTGGDLGSQATFNHAGTGGGGGLPNNVAQCISWSLTQRYKGGHPRTYLPAPGDVALQDSRLYLASQTGAVTAAANTFHGQVNGLTHGALSDIHLGTVSFVLRGQWRTPPVFRDFVLNGARMDARIDSMRRRLGRDII